MESYQGELVRIKELLRESPHGMSVTEIARALNKNNHSVGRYLDILHVSGQVEMRTYGKAKVFTLSSRIPIDTILGFAHDLIIVLDRDYRIVRVNDTFLDVIRKKRDEIVGKNISFIPVVDQRAETLLERLRQSLSAGIVDQEITIPDESPRFFRQKNIPTVFEDGQQGVTIILEDITVQKSAERDLRKSEEQFRLMAENIRDGLIIRQNQAMIYINRRVGEIFGYSHEELAGINPRDLAAPEDRERFDAVLQEISEKNELPTDLTFWIVRKDGSRRFIYNRLTSVRRGDDLFLYIIITDMTDWKRSQEALENQLGFLQHLVDTFPSPVFYVDMHERFLGCNAAFARMLGRTRGEIAGRSYEEILGPRNQKIFREKDELLHDHPGVITYSGSIEDATGTIRTVLIQKSTFTTTDGSPGGVVGLILSNTDVQGPAG